MTKSPSATDLINALDEPALLIDDERVAAANRAARDLFGTRILGSDVRLVVRHPLVLEHLLRARGGDVAVDGLGGSSRSWNVSVRPIGSDQVLLRLNDRSIARAAEQMRVDFVANASHELKTPLTTIIGYSETLCETEPLEREIGARFAGIIQSEANRMLQIIDDLMSLSRIEAERFVPPEEPIDLADIVTIAVDQARPLADRMQCKIELEVQPGLPKVRGDRGQILQILDNLLNNALRYGCGSAGCTIFSEARFEAGQLIVTVRDTGEGIPREHLPRLTERFYRVDAARSRDSGGTGLGLAIVKHIVERHRGSLEIDSVVGRGTQVIVRLPPL